MQVDAKAGGELVPDHAGGLAVQDPVAGQTAGEYLDGWFEVHRVGFQEGQCFGDEFDSASHDQLIRRLHGLTRAGRPTCTTVEPSVSRTGRAASKSAAVPPTM